MIPLRFRRFAGAAAAAAWILFGATAVVLLFCGDAALLSREMAAHAPPETTGLPASEYAGVSRMIADYLLGRTDRFQYEYAGPSGTPVQCFRPHEEAHMADVRALVRLDRRVMLVSLGAALLLSAAGLAGSRPGLPGPAPAARTGGAEGDAGRPAFWRGVRARGRELRGNFCAVPSVCGEAGDSVEAVSDIVPHADLIGEISAPRLFNV